MINLNFTVLIILELFTIMPLLYPRASFLNVKSRKMNKGHSGIREFEFGGIVCDQLAP